MDTATDSENSPFRGGSEIMNLDTPILDKASSSDQSRKRPAPSPDHAIQRRTRGTYTPVAWYDMNPSRCFCLLQHRFNRNKLLRRVSVMAVRSEN